MGRKTLILDIQLVTYSKLWLLVSAERAILSTSTPSQGGPWPAFWGRTLSPPKRSESHLEYFASKAQFPKLSIKEQIKAILKAYSWAPAQLKYKSILRMMTISQTTKYGATIKQFVKEYNSTYKRMNLSTKRHMPRNFSFQDILALSRSVNQASPKSVRELVQAMGDHTVKQLLVNSMHYYLQNAKYKNVLDANHEKSKFRAHYNLINSVSLLQNAMCSEHVYEGSPIFQLSSDLILYVCSFLDPVSLSNVSFSCHSLCKASVQSSARSELQIRANKLAFKKPHLSTITLKQCRSIQTLSLNNLQRGYEHKFERIFKELVVHSRNLKCLKMDSIAGNSPSSSTSSSSLYHILR